MSRTSRDLNKKLIENSLTIDCLEQKLLSLKGKIVESAEESAFDGCLNIKFTDGTNMSVYGGATEPGDTAGIIISLY